MSERLQPCNNCGASISSRCTHRCPKCSSDSPFELCRICSRPFESENPKCILSRVSPIHIHDSCFREGYSAVPATCRLCGAQLPNPLSGGYSWDEDGSWEACDCPDCGASSPYTWDRCGNCTLPIAPDSQRSVDYWVVNRQASYDYSAPSGFLTTVHDHCRPADAFDSEEQTLEEWQTHYDTYAKPARYRLNIAAGLGLGTVCGLLTGLVGGANSCARNGFDLGHSLFDFLLWALIGFVAAFVFGFLANRPQEDDVHKKMRERNDPAWHEVSRHGAV